jgi:hypothetical protein
LLILEFIKKNLPSLNEIREATRNVVLILGAILLILVLLAGQQFVNMLKKFQAIVFIIESTKIRKMRRK